MICDRCHGRGFVPDDADRLELEVDRLRAGCAVLGIAPRWDDTVTEPDVAQLPHRSPATLANWRSAGTGPSWERGRRVRYRLHDLAAWALADRGAK